MSEDLAGAGGRQESVPFRQSVARAGIQAGFTLHVLTTVVLAARLPPISPVRRTLLVLLSVPKDRFEGSPCFRTR